MKDILTPAFLSLGSLVLGKPDAMAWGHSSSLKGSYTQRETKA